jgi:hypothetical protein
VRHVWSLIRHRRGSVRWRVRRGGRQCTHVEMTAGGASMPPRRKSLPGVAMAMRIRSPYLSMAATCNTTPARAMAFTAAEPARHTAMKMRIVTVGFRVGDRSRGLFTTPADFPRQDCTPYRGLHVRRECLDLYIVQGPFSVANPMCYDSQLVHRCIDRAVRACRQLARHRSDSS